MMIYKTPEKIKATMSKVTITSFFVLLYLSSARASENIYFTLHDVVFRCGWGPKTGSRSSIELLNLMKKV